MKRLRVDETVKEVSSNLYHRSPIVGNSASSSIGTYNNTSVSNPGSIGGSGGGGGGGGVSSSNVKNVVISSEGSAAAGSVMQSSLYSAAQPVSYSAMPAAAAPHSGKPQAMQPLTMGGHSQVRSKGASPPTAQPQGAQQQQQQQSPGSSFQRLKVEDALSYLDMVKYKFGDKPQVYNDFLDIMKEFKSQSIDTPGVIQRVSNLFRGYPELIVGFNTFLPPGYKIEVQRSEQGYAFQVSVSMPSPTGAMMAADPQQPQKPSMILSGSGTIIQSNVGSLSANANLPSNQQQQQQQQPITISALQQQQPQQPQVVSTVTNNPSYNNTVTFNSSTGNLHPNNVAAHNSLTLSAAQAAVTLQGGGGQVETPQNQPVEFNHAINYVNKIKNRFQGQPEKYKRFLEILHTYQKEQRTMKEVAGQGPGKHLTEQEVYSQVAKLFENQGDLLAEFGQFLPDATSHISSQPSSFENVQGGGGLKKQLPSKPYRDHIPERHLSSHKPSHLSGVAVKRSPPYSSNSIRDAPPPKKHKVTSLRDVTLVEATKWGTLHEYAFFDKVRKAVKSPEAYNNFLRCLTLFNLEIVSKSELVQLVTPFLSKSPDLMRWFREFLGQQEVEAIPYNVTRTERPQGEHLAHEIDYTTAKRLGASYVGIPPSQEGLKFSGRTTLCHEVLNNQWVSFPTWSEDTAFQGSRKNQYEEYMYRCEDERFELDVVIETNASTIRVLEGVAKKLSRMSPDEVSKFRLDDCLGGSSPVLQQRALKRIYGEKAQDIIDGLKRNPAVAVPVVLRRLKSKEEEWREAQKGFNKIWREQNEKHYLKSLDYQGINFKQNDTKALRSKSLFADIEQAFEERNEQVERGFSTTAGPHLVFVYQDRSVLDDAANLLIHHVKRQTGVQKAEKRRIKHLLRQVIPDWFFHPRQQLSDDEREEDEDKDEGNESPNSSSSKEDGKKKGDSSSPAKSPARGDSADADDKSQSADSLKTEIKEEETETPLHAQTNDPDEVYTMFMASNNWYLFLRLHAVLCERLAKIYHRAVKMAEDESVTSKNRKDSTAVALRLKPKPQIEIDEYYPAFLDLVKNLLDGNMDSNTYEDTLREMFGIHAYIAFTLDKVIQYAMRQLQHCVTERLAITALDLYVKEQKCGATGGPCATAHRRLHQEMQYQRAMEKAVQDENCYKMYIYKNDGRMTIELIEADNVEVNKKIEENKKWSTYKENYADCSNVESKPSSPLFLGRNMRKYNKKNKRRSSTTSNDKNSAADEDNNSKFEGGSSGTMDDDLERKLMQRGAPERDQSEQRDYDVSDETQCRFNTADSKIIYVANKDSFLYKRSALTRAKQTHPAVTKYKSSRFRGWCKKWVSVNVSDGQMKQCTDWLMGRSDSLVPNRTRILTNSDLNRSPYVLYNRYTVELVNNGDQST